MSNKDREFVTRSENVRREQRTLKQKKLDRLLNGLIAIVVILILINLYIIFSDEDGKEFAQEQTTENNMKKPIENNSNLAKEEKQSDLETEDVGQVITTPSNDPLVEELIIDASWQATPTKQQGEHVSSYKVGDIDYEEKIETFLNAVQLTKQETIIWSVRNNGSADTSKAVLSTSDKTKIYRVSIEWIADEGWKPVKVERLKQIEGAF